MARRPPPAAPPLDAPLAAELLRAPTAFFARLQAVPPRPWRYVAPALLTALLAGAVYALLLRPVAAVGSGVFTAQVLNVFGTFFLTVLAAALMAGLGVLGAGRTGRAAEVYGATFVLLPPLYLLLSALLLVLPGPQGGGAVGGDQLAAQRAALQTVAQAPLTHAAVLVIGLGTLAQFVLAYRGFLILTGDARRALLGTLLPLPPVLALTALGLAPLLAALF